MIAQLTGKIAEKNLSTIVLDVNGVGYLLRVSNRTLENISHKKDPVTFYTYLAVRENSMDLYAFSEKEELEFFELLLTISGIGPKSALAILSSSPVETIREGITSGDANYLTKVSGIGKKNAEKIILELKDKIGGITDPKFNSSEGGMAIEALMSLGYSERDAREAIQKVDKTLKTADMVKEALKQLGK